jgi:hypothetical protein
VALAATVPAMATRAQPSTSRAQRLPRLNAVSATQPSSAPQAMASTPESRACARAMGVIKPAIPSGSPSGTLTAGRKRGSHPDW